MNVEELLSGESKNVEYKVRRPEKSIKYIKFVVAFANGSGGYLSTDNRGENCHCSGN